MFGVPSSRFLEVADGLASAAAAPELVLVTAGGPRPLVVLEGHVRLTAYALRPALVPLELEVLLGTSPLMTGWALY